jgi:hypothetical protein
MSRTRKRNLGKQEIGEGAFNDSGAPADYAELATFTRPWEAWLVRDALVDRGIEAWVDDAGMDNPSAPRREWSASTSLWMIGDGLANLSPRPSASRPPSDPRPNSGCRPGV